MKKDDIYKRSLELAEKDIWETPREEMEAMIKKYDDMKIEGPTIDEYFDILQKELGGIFK